MWFVPDTIWRRRAISGFPVSDALGVTRRGGIGLAEGLRKTVSDDGGDFAHQLAEFFPFLRTQVCLDLRVQRPFGIDELSFA